MTDDATQTILSQQIFEEAPVFLIELKSLGAGNVLVLCWDYISDERVAVSIISGGGATIEMLRRDPQVTYIAVKSTLLD